MAKEKQKKGMDGFVDIPKGVTASLSGTILSVKGKNEVSRNLRDKQVKLAVKDGKVLITCDDSNKKVKTKIGTAKAHIKNMIRGAVEGHTYELKICSGHFPMTVNCTKTEFTVKNFYGEKTPRVLKIPNDVTVTVEGEKVTVSANEIEKAGQIATLIEKLTRRPNFDTRIFQDGIYITKKSGKNLK